MHGSRVLASRKPPCASCGRDSGTGRHRTPGWQPSEPWGQSVSSYAIDDGERLLLFDPLAAPSELEELAASRETAVVLTNPWHERDTQSLVEPLGVPVFTPLPDTAEDLARARDARRADRPRGPRARALRTP